MTAKTTEYKGNPMLELKNSDDDKWPFSFGIGKAKKILAHIEDIRKFVTENDKPKKQEEGF